jgi:hypothetical protein
MKIINNVIFSLVTAGSKITCKRCYAKSKRTGNQCGAPAERGKNVCRFHGARSTGAKTEAGKARIAAALTIHGRETREQRALRSAASARISQLEDAMHILKMTTSSRMRGRKALGYKPVTSMQDVVQLVNDDLLHRNTGARRKTDFLCRNTPCTEAKAEP